MFIAKIKNEINDLSITYHLEKVIKINSNEWLLHPDNLALGIYYVA